MTDQWKTAITDDKDGGGRIRGYKIEELIGGRSFAETSWLLLRGELPEKNQAALFDAMLVAVADHGIAVPSATAARIVLSGGNSLNAAVAAGVLAAGDFHGGAIEGCMRMLAAAAQAPGEPKDIAASVVDQMEVAGVRILGYGHKIFEIDPRTTRLFSLARELGVNGRAMKIAEAIAAALSEKKGRPLPLNVDGAIAALLCEMGFPPETGKAVFLIGRIAGICAHVVEERSREKPFRRLGEEEYRYDGPPPRDLPPK